MAEVWDQLREAHDRAAVPGEGELPRHAPKAAVLSCSDARVPPSVLFDQPAGSLFVIRVAGNTANPAALASLDYAVEHLGVELIVVLGHTDCGAVAAAVAGTCGGDYGPVTAPICTIVRDHPHDHADTISGRNVQSTMTAIADHHGPSGDAVRSGRVQVEGAVHDLRSAMLRTPQSLITTTSSLETS